MKTLKMFCLLTMFLMIGWSQTAEAGIPHDNDDCKGDIEKRIKNTLAQCVDSGKRIDPEHMEQVKARCETEARKRRIICEEEKRFEKLPQNQKYPPPPSLEASTAEWKKWERKIDGLIEEYPWADKGQYPQNVARFRIDERRKKAAHDQKKLNEMVKSGMAPSAPAYNASDDQWNEWHAKVNYFISAQPDQNSAYVRRLKSWRDEINRKRENYNRTEDPAAPDDIRKKGDGPVVPQESAHDSAPNQDKDGEDISMGEKQDAEQEWWPAEPVFPESPIDKSQCKDFEKQWDRYIKRFFDNKYKDAEAFGGDARKLSQLDVSIENFKLKKQGEVERCYRRVAAGNRSIGQSDASVDLELEKYVADVEAKVESVRDQNNPSDKLTSELNDARKNFGAAITNIDIKNGKTRDKILLSASYNNMNSMNAAEGYVGSGAAPRKISIRPDTCQADDGNGEVAAAIENGRRQGYSTDQMISLIRRQIEAHRRNLNTLDLRSEEHRKVKANLEETIAVNQAVLDALECMKRKGHAAKTNTNASANKLNGERSHNGSGQYYPTFEPQIAPIKEDFEPYCGIGEACNDRKLRQLRNRQEQERAAPASGRTQRGIR